jgi:hypothetical protein
MHTYTLDIIYIHIDIINIYYNIGVHVPVRAGGDVTIQRHAQIARKGDWQVRHVEQCQHCLRVLAADMLY